MKRFNFWQKWLFILGILTCLGGIFFAFSSFANFELAGINSVFWPDTVISPEVRAFQGWIYGVCFTLTVVFGLFIVFIANNAFKKKEPWAWNCLATCILVWFVIETFFSVYYGVYSIVGNSVFQLVVLMLPLIFTRKDFKANSGSSSERSS